ncbi:hypothetical protein C7S16_5896 [Burkholderia thailandensis]|uniref:Uncharacterized protein n=1 Tax=Burkholderia thailandensis TaxID=57975 RepID=A0AAW9CRP4_BURTH|nr:hypothetical protein [Burkholderia thailandensis]
MRMRLVVRGSRGDALRTDPERRAAPRRALGRRRASRDGQAANSLIISAVSK